MQTLKRIISHYMRSVTLLLVIALLGLLLYFQITYERRQAYEAATESFYRIEQLMEKNQEELVETKKAYRQTCLHNAEAISYMIEDDPSVLDSVDELQKIAALMEVDEIHIFDTTGRIYAGTHPEYYDYTFDSGEQMMFFKPMLTDKSLRLVQEITPNTAEAKLMQYSALWNRDESFIVQVGMKPANVLKAAEKMISPTFFHCSASIPMPVITLPTWKPGKSSAPPICPASEKTFRKSDSASKRLPPAKRDSSQL